jgi:hypothetical protein
MREERPKELATRATEPRVDQQPNKEISQLVAGSLAQYAESDCGDDSIRAQIDGATVPGSLGSPGKINPEQDPSDAEAGRHKCHQGEIAIHLNGARSCSSSAHLLRCA